MEDTHVGFDDITPEGYECPVFLFLDADATNSDEAIKKAGAFFDQLKQWDELCRNAFAAVSEGSEDYEMVMEYFDFYRDEVPEVFDVDDVSELTLPDMVNCLLLTHMATQHSGAEQVFTVDFTLGYDQLLCAYFNADSELDYIAWES